MRFKLLKPVASKKLSKPKTRVVLTPAKGKMVLEKFTIRVKFTCGENS